MRRDNLTVLVVEDAPDDQLLLKIAFKSCQQVGLSLQMISSGNEAIEYLQGEGRYSDRNEFPYPSFLLTDLMMPHGDGFSVLAHLKSTPDAAIIPSVVLSGSNDADDIRNAYRLGASAYLTKPGNHEELKEMVRALVGFWMMCEVPAIDHQGRQVVTEGSGKLGQHFE